VEEGMRVYCGGVNIWRSGIDKRMKCGGIALLFVCSQSQRSVLLGLDVLWMRKRLDSIQRGPSCILVMA
jgi:hypothetical protein